MAGLAWFKLASDFPSHPKTRALAVKLRDPNAGMYVVRLWGFCAQHAQDGRLDGESVESIIELACEWKAGKRQGLLVEALVSAGFLESQGGGVYVVHGWQERNGAHAKKAAADARKPRGNKRRPASVPPSSPEGPARDDGGSRGGDRDQEEDPSSLRSEGAPPEAAAPAASEGQQDANASSTASTEAAPPAGAARDAGGEEQEGSASPPAAGKAPFALAVSHWFEAWERAGRGKHARLTLAEGKQIKDLLAEFGLDELRARMDRALADRWFLEHGDLLAFVKQRNRFAKPGAPGRAAADELAARREAAVAREAETCEESARTLRRLFEIVRPDFFDTWATGLRGSLDGQTLRFRHPEPGKALFWADQHHALLLRAAREANGVPLHVEITGPTTEGRA